MITKRPSVRTSVRLYVRTSVNFSTEALYTVPLSIFFFIFSIWLYMDMEQNPIETEPYRIKIVTLAGV